MAGESMRVRMAEALFRNDAKWRNHSWAHAHHSVRSMFLADVDAVVAVMRPATEGMLAAASAGGLDERIPATIWDTMVNAIVAERFADKEEWR